MNESYEWILRAIESSTNSFHFQGCDTLISLFYKRYGPPNGGNDQFDKDYVELDKALTEKRKSQE